VTVGPCRISSVCLVALLVAEHHARRQPVMAARVRPAHSPLSANHVRDCRYAPGHTSAEKTERQADWLGLTGTARAGHGPRTGFCAGTSVQRIPASSSPRNCHAASRKAIGGHALHQASARVPERQPASTGRHHAGDAEPAHRGLCSRSDDDPRAPEKGTRASCRAAYCCRTIIRSRQDCRYYSGRLSHSQVHVLLSTMC